MQPGTHDLTGRCRGIRPALAIAHLEHGAL
jgi:hypothetical protein